MRLERDSDACDAKRREEDQLLEQGRIMSQLTTEGGRDGIEN